MNISWRIDQILRKLSENVLYMKRMSPIEIRYLMPHTCLGMPRFAQNYFQNYYTKITFIMITFEGMIWFWWNFQGMFFLWGNVLLPPMSSHFWVNVSKLSLHISLVMYLHLIRSTNKRSVQSVYLLVVLFWFIFIWNYVFSYF